MSEKKKLSRSDIVRQRRRANLYRQSRVQKKRSRANNQNSNRGLPPITTRGVVNEFAIERHKKAKKRRFNAVLSLSRPKTHVQQKSGFKFRIGWRLLSFFLVLLLGAGLYMFWTDPQFRVSGVKVVGNQRLSLEEINNVLELNGKPIFSIEPELIREQALRHYSELTTVSVTVSMPNLVTLYITERQPIIQWQQESGYTWIDETGTAFQPNGDGQGLIIVQALGEPGFNPISSDDPLLPPVFMPENTVKSIIALAPHVPPGSVLIYDSENGLSWDDGRGWKAVFGTSGHNIETKILVYQAIVDWLSQRSIRPRIINVAYPKAPFYRMELAETQVEEQ